jgi:signal peptidase I|tara:strand:- start:260 stop:571 length:312 start_codon:yes stop_codon:yes gene_type:complete
MFKIGIDKIVGGSMSPTIKDGSFVIFFSSKKMKITPNKVYRLSHPQFGSIIKRLSFEDADGNFWFKGDSHDSTSLKKIGAITKQQINGRIWLTIDIKSCITFL